MNLRNALQEPKIVTMEHFESSLLSLFHIGIYIQNLNKFLERKLGLSLVQRCLLKHLIDMPAASAYSLAKAVGVHPSTLSQTLKRLERRKFIYIAEDPKDSRRKLISITRSGKEALDRTNKALENCSNLLPLSKDLQRIQAILKTHEEIFQREIL